MSVISTSSDTLIVLFLNLLLKFLLLSDLLYFSFAISRGTTGINTQPTFNALKAQGILNPIERLNNLRIEDTDFNINKCFIYQNYSPNASCERMYFQNANALKIDIIRLQIEQWKNDNLLMDDEYYYLLASLLLKQTVH